MIFGPKEICALRAKLGVSVAQFARRMCVTRGTVYLWESGHSHPRYAEMVELNKLAEEAALAEPESQSA